VKIGFLGTMALLVVWLAFDARAHAQQGPSEPGPAPAEGPAAATGRAARAARKPAKVIEMDVLEVVGKVQKPRVYYVIGRGELKYQGLPLERDLLKEVEDAVERPPF